MNIWAALFLIFISSLITFFLTQDYVWQKASRIILEEARRNALSKLNGDIVRKE